MSQNETILKIFELKKITRRITFKYKKDIGYVKDLDKIKNWG